jgi:hypothetical protein
MTTTPTQSAEERLERGELVFLAQSPFSLPQGDDLAFLHQQRLGGRFSKNITFNPHTGELTGFARQSGEQVERLRRLLADFSRAVTVWLGEAMPRYRGGIEPDRASFRTEEEATRRLRRNARNDLLHIDAFPGRPARGRRILRVFANINACEPRVWATSGPLPWVLERFGDKVKRSSVGWLHRLGAGMLGLFHRDHERSTASDLFMLRLHDYLKRNLEFQQRGPRRLWRFPPGSAWLAMTDGCAHAELRGRFALEHSFFIAPQVLALPELAPERLLAASRLSCSEDERLAATPA